MNRLKTLAAGAALAGASLVTTGVSAQPMLPDGARPAPHHRVAPRHVHGHGHAHGHGHRHHHRLHRHPHRYPHHHYHHAGHPTRHP